jgi:hypothetical protein
MSEFWGIQRPTLGSDVDQVRKGLGFKISLDISQKCSMEDLDGSQPGLTEGKLFGLVVFPRNRVCFVSTE